MTDRAPTQLDLPVLRVLAEGTYLTALIKPTIRGRRREHLLTAARNRVDLTDTELETIDKKTRPPTPANDHESPAQALTSSPTPEPTL